MLLACYNHVMGNLQIKDIPEDLHVELRRRAAQRGTTMRDYLLWLIERDQRLPVAAEWLEQVRSDERVSAETSAAELIRAGRREQEDRMAEGLSRT